ncbi:MAG: hypothetical protein IV087_18590 [Acidovorax sp.]|jgi:hypothetical protein|nr:hypothetical protein [Acidovorax sp.]
MGGIVGDLNDQPACRASGFEVIFASSAYPSSASSYQNESSMKNQMHRRAACSQLQHCAARKSCYKNNSYQRFHTQRQNHF